MSSIDLMGYETVMQKLQKKELHHINRTNLKEEIESYWDTRSADYSSHILQELGGSCYRAWSDTLSWFMQPYLGAACSQKRTCRMLDVGCGPGFLSILCAQLQGVVDAIDSSADMLAQAYKNVEQLGLIERVSLHRADALNLPFENERFDVVVSRNVTWLMQDLSTAYTEWQRVLMPGGLLLVFDANWYRYLDDELINMQRQADEECAAVSREEVNGCATQQQEELCEEIARHLPCTYVDRPELDIHVLENLGFVDISVDERICTSLWSSQEQQVYASSPLFCLAAKKDTAEG